MRTLVHNGRYSGQKSDYDERSESDEKLRGDWKSRDDKKSGASFFTVFEMSTKAACEVLGSTLKGPKAGNFIHAIINAHLGTPSTFLGRHAFLLLGMSTPKRW